jgi:hypothetical protein
MAPTAEHVAFALKKLARSQDEQMIDNQDGDKRGNLCICFP